METKREATQHPTVLDQMIERCKAALAEDAAAAAAAAAGSNDTTAENEHQEGPAK